MELAQNFNRSSGAKCARTPSSCVDMLLTRADISGGMVSVGAATGAVSGMVTSMVQ